jgi:purine-binding chemotaxis protein CheW
MKNISKLLIFQIVNQRFALPLDVVRKVIQVVEFTPLPKMSAYIYGVINYHGDIIPVVNMSYLFSIESKELSISDRLIIVSTSKGKLALLASIVHEVVEINHEDIVTPDRIIYGMNFIHGAVKLRDGMVLINDIDKFLSEDELKKLEEEIKKNKETIENQDTNDEDVSTLLNN